MVPHVSGLRGHHLGMAKTQLGRTGMTQYSSDNDLWPGRVGFNSEYSNLNDVVAIWGQGTTAARPVSAYAGRYFFALDTQRLWYDNGSAWTEISPVGGGGAALPAKFTGASEGSSRIAARADHVHALTAPDALPGQVSYGGSAAAGSAATAARADHTHNLDGLPLSVTAGGTVVENTAGVAGVSTSVARADHTHAFTAYKWGGDFQGTAGIPSDGVTRIIPMTTVGDAKGGASITAGRTVVPVTGIYAGFTRVAFNIAEETAAGLRCGILEIAGVGSRFGMYVQSTYPHSTVVFVPFRVRVAGGTSFGVLANQTSGVVQSPDVELCIDLIALG